MLQKNRITPHPGEILNEEFLEPLGLSANALALALRVPANRPFGVMRSWRFPADQPLYARAVKGYGVVGGHSHPYGGPRGASLILLLSTAGTYFP